MNRAQRVVIAIGLAIIGGMAFFRDWTAYVYDTDFDPWWLMLGVAAITAALAVAFGGKRSRPAD